MNLEKNLIFKKRLHIENIFDTKKRPNNISYRLKKKILNMYMNDIENLECLISKDLTIWKKFK